jgi:hypothetical protein
LSNIVIVSEILLIISFRLISVLSTTLLVGYWQFAHHICISVGPKPTTYYPQVSPGSQFRYLPVGPVANRRRRKRSSSRN